MAFVSAVRQRVGDACLIQAERQVCGWNCSPARASEAFGETILSESGPFHFTSPSILLPAQQDMLSETEEWDCPQATWTQTAADLIQNIPSSMIRAAGAICFQGSGLGPRLAVRTGTAVWFHDKE